MVKSSQPDVTEAHAGALSPLDAIVNASEDLVATADAEQRLLTLNRAGRSMLGLKGRDSVSGLTLADLHAENAAKQFAAVALPAAELIGVWRGRTTLRASTGKFIEGRQVLIVHKDESGSVTGYTTLVRDVTAQLRAEAELRQAQKMAAVGQLASGVAHDFNNLLGAIASFAELLSRQRPQPEREKHARKILKICERAADLNRQLLTFARPEEVHREPLDLREIVTEVVSLFERTLDRTIEIKTHFHQGSGTVMGDPTQLQHLILNLGVNARDAMPQGGVLKLSTRRVELDGTTPASAPVKLPAGPYLALEVSDTGTGMDELTKSRVFEPFFTTKKAGSGTGLGLAVAYGTAETHGGSIEVHTELGVGTQFVVYLPCGEEEAEKADSVLPELVPAGNNHILLVDDEEPIRTAVSEQLQDLGYTVTAVSDGQSALDTYRAGGVDLVLLDVVMPKLNGAQTLQALREIDPDVKVVMMSGYGHQSALREIEKLGPNGFLTKPFRIGLVVQELARALA